MEAIMYIVIAVMIVMIPMLIIVFIFFSKGTRFLYFNTDRTAKMVRKRGIDKESSVKIDGKKFALAEAKPTIYKRFMGVSPLYIVKHDSVFPLEFGSDKLNSPNPSPAEIQALTKLGEMKALLSKPKKDTGFVIILGTIGFVMGFLMAFVFIATKIITF